MALPGKSKITTAIVYQMVPGHVAAKVSEKKMTMRKQWLLEMSVKCRSSERSRLEVPQRMNKLLLRCQ